ncbi:Anaphase-promoting complex subunit 7 [Citrus sinensis]|uniref:Anaphase-promoting complex subunit 7 n=1 Tax=Citrus sinensis TaxID=2711 RepID=A0ACB8I825_CITSI|nr:Anaphase-promoting complex subunit 7 [Citrus sinensis]
MEVPKEQITALIDQGLYDSAQMLIILGDSLFRDREYRRAIHTYKQALHYYKIVPKQNSTSSRSSLSTSNRSSSPNSFNVSAINENEVKYKIASCHFALGETKAAIVEMEGIPSKARNLQMSLLMAKLYRNSRHNRGAVACYKECLRHCPFFIEAITALAELGATPKDIISLFAQTTNRSGRALFDHLDSSRWLQRYVEAQCCIASNDYKVSAFVTIHNHTLIFRSTVLAGGLELFAELLQRFPNNIHILLEMAKVRNGCTSINIRLTDLQMIKYVKVDAIIGKNDEAIINFEKVVRSIDPYILTYMDEYAMLLKVKCDYSKLSKLVHDLLSIDPSRPEVFVALSVLWERKDERGALSYAEKGNLLLSMKRPEAAVIAFRGAQELRPDLRSYQGLVHSYLQFSKVKEALYAAREAMKAMPQSAKALKLVGDVHASNASGREKAKKFYESALRLEPGYLGAALALAELHVIEGRNGDAVSLLERYLKDWADDSLHVKLAQVFAATNMLQEALSHYEAALRINSQNEAAKKGLERLEKQMKGVDPDAPEEDEENEVEDAEGDQEETDLL